MKERSLDHSKKVENLSVKERRKRKRKRQTPSSS